MLDLTPKSGAVVAAAFALGLGASMLGDGTDVPALRDVPPSSVHMISLERDQELDVTLPGYAPLTFTGDSVGCFDATSNITRVDANGVPQTTFRVRNHCDGRRLHATTGARP